MFCENRQLTNELKSAREEIGMYSESIEQKNQTVQRLSEQLYELEQSVPRGSSPATTPPDRRRGSNEVQSNRPNSSLRLIYNTQEIEKLQVRCRIFR